MQHDAYEHHDFYLASIQCTKSIILCAITCPALEIALKILWAL